MVDSTNDRRTHWERVYQTRLSTEVSWYQPYPTRSVELLTDAGLGPQHAIIDVGGGDSTLVDTLVAHGFAHVTVLDIASAALARARARLGKRASMAKWIEADVTGIDLIAQAYDAWHDRAVFHFLTDTTDRARYVALVHHTVRPGGIVLLATFASDGPTRCSGLDVAQYSATDIADVFGDEFVLVRDLTDVHHTPAGVSQKFTYAVLRRRSL